MSLIEMKSPQIDPNKRERVSHAVSEVVKNVTKHMLKYELGRAIEELGPQEAAKVVIQVFRLKGLPKELRRHL